MKQILFLLLIFNTGFIICQKSLAAPNPNPPDFGMQAGLFYSSLSPHGEWIETEPGFHVWRPLHIQREWRPYLLGRWVWTDDYGWYWMSNEPFGWITYHYGRWYNDEYYGWVWMPDDVWGPAWVEWRYDNDYIGWAPLPPYATFNISFGMRFSTHWIAPIHYWNFVRYHRFGAIIHYRDIASEEHTRRLIHTTRTGSQYEVDHDHIVNRGVDRTMIEQRGNLRIPKTEVREVREQSGERMIRGGDNNRTQHIEMYRPSRDEIQRDIERIEARRGTRALSIDMKKIERPRVEPRTPSDERSRRDPVRTEEQPKRSIQREVQPQEQRRDREIQRQEQPRDYTPRAQERKPQQDRKEMRRELIQRYERKQNPSPPAVNKTPQQRIDGRRTISPNTQYRQSTPEQRSSHSGDKRRRD